MPNQADVTPDEAQAHRQIQAITDTTTKVQKLVPNFKRSIWHSAATQYKNTWNKQIDDGKYPASMKVK